MSNKRTISSSYVKHTVESLIYDAPVGAAPSASSFST